MKKVFLLILVIGLVACNKQNTTVSVDPCPDKTAQLRSCQDLVQSLQSQILTLTAENARLQAELDCLTSKVTITKVSSTKPVATTKKTVKAPAATKPSAPAPVKKAALMPEANPGSPGTASRANLDYLRYDGVISYCVMVNDDKGLHFPQKALESGATFSSIEQNPTNDGTNWIVEPIEWKEGDYGVTVDGTFFVSNEMLEKVLKIYNIPGVTSVQIKAPWTQWGLKSMTKVDGNWEYDARR